MGRFTRCWYLVLVGLFGGLTAQAESPVWALRGAHNTVYLAGSIHLLKPDSSALPAGFDRAYADADELVMEVDLDDLDQGEVQSWMLQHAMFEDEQTLRTTIGDTRYQRVATEAQRLGLPIEGLQQFEPWMVALTLVELEYVKLGFDPEQGVEKQLERRARADKKPITGLETIPEQLGLLDGLSYDDQARFLDLTVTELRDAEQETDTLVAAWRAGDARKLASLLGEEYDTFPGLYRTLVTDRNKRWMPEIERMLRDDKDYMVVVGALHLVSDGGLLQLVKAKGFEARQLQ